MCRRARRCNRLQWREAALQLARGGWADWLDETSASRNRALEGDRRARVLLRWEQSRTRQRTRKSAEIRHRSARRRAFARAARIARMLLWKIVRWCRMRRVATRACDVGVRASWRRRILRAS